MHRIELGSGFDEDHRAALKSRTNKTPDLGGLQVVESWTFFQRALHGWAWRPGPEHMPVRTPPEDEGAHPQKSGMPPNCKCPGMFGR